MDDAAASHAVERSPAHDTASHSISWNEAFWTWARVAALSFGGPAGQIAVMHRILGADLAQKLRARNVAAA